MNAQRNLFNVSSRLQGNYARLSSGLRIATAADDAAGLGISEKMRADIRGYGVASRNAQDGLSLSQTAEGALDEVSGILTRMRELALQSSTGTINDGDRATLDTEYQELLLEIDRIASDTEFNDLALLDGSNSTISVQVGLDISQTIDVTLSATTTTDLGVDSTDVAAQGNAEALLATLDTAIDSINTSRGTMGADQNRLQSALRSILNVRENISAAESRIRDVDVALETADLTRNSILQQAATSVLAQANAQPQLALSLLG
jgi:flagellin